MYVDDISIFARTAAAAAIIRDAIIADLQNAGFTVNFEKSQLIPTQALRALGWTIDTNEHRFVALEDRQRRITALLEGTATAQTMDVRELAAVAGTKMFPAHQCGVGTKYCRNLFLGHGTLWWPAYKQSLPKVWWGRIVDAQRSLW